MDTLIDTSYTWEKASICFRSGNLLATPWCLGTYELVHPNKVEATWGGYTHTLTFTPDFKAFTSVRAQDGETVTGTLVPKEAQSKIPSIRLDYKNAKCELCELGRRYNVDKSSQRDNPGPDDSHHCHPYSLLYHALFSKRRQDPLTFCEIGIAEGRSLLMWNDYFPNAAIYGFEYLEKWLINWYANYADRTRVHVNYMNVRTDETIIKPFLDTKVQYDCIIDDSSHMFYDMIRIIRQGRSFLKPGGMLIIEDIRRSFDELWFWRELQDILDEFQLVTFVDLEHDRRNSGSVQNDKVLILIKKGAAPIIEFNLF